MKKNLPPICRKPWPGIITVSFLSVLVAMDFACAAQETDKPAVVPFQQQKSDSLTACKRVFAIPDSVTGNIPTVVPVRSIPPTGKRSRIFNSCPGTAISAWFASTIPTQTPRPFCG